MWDLHGIHFWLDGRPDISSGCAILLLISECNHSSDMSGPVTTHLAVFIHRQTQCCFFRPHRALSLHPPQHEDCSSTLRNGHYRPLLSLLLCHLRRSSYQGSVLKLMEGHATTIDFHMTRTLDVPSDCILHWPLPHPALSLGRVVFDRKWSPFMVIDDARLTCMCL